MREKPHDKARVSHMLESIDTIFEFVEGKDFAEYSDNKMLRFAVIKNLEIIGEAAYLLSKELKSQHPHIEWSVIVGMRHVLVHGYYQIKDEIIWATIQTELLPLREKLEELYSSLDEE